MNTGCPQTTGYMTCNPPAFAVEEAYNSGFYRWWAKASARTQAKVPTEILLFWLGAISINLIVVGCALRHDNPAIRYKSGMRLHCWKAIRQEDVYANAMLAD